MAGPLLQPLLLLLLSSALGSPGQARSHPWQVALYHHSVFQCAGVLINQQWVLTSAHCHKSEYIVQMGSDLLVGGRALKIRATESFVHHRYNNDTHDIMLVKLSSPAKLSPNVQTINLPSSCKDPGTSCTVSGWGLTTMDNAATNPSELICSNVNLISYKDCRKTYQTVSKKYMICVAAPNGLSSTCKGDSGGPLICQGSLQGLVSSGYYPCTSPFEPVIYTRLCMYRKWIYNTMKTNS